MKILQAIHDFLPRHQAGSELYCYHLSKGLQKRGHDVTMFYSEIDHTRENYSVHRVEYDGLPGYEIINNHAYSSFEDTYQNPKVEEAFSRCLDEVKPEVVHFHHLLSLSYGCVEQCKRRGIRVVFTLHDYWLTCPRGGGQRFRGEGKVCHDVDTSLCARCVSRYAFPSAGVRLIKRLLAPFEQESDATLLTALSKGKVKTDNRNFVSVGSCVIENDERRVLFSHPASSILIRERVPQGATLHFSYAMAPSTYEQEGGGVAFSVLVNGTSLFEAPLEAKSKSEDQGWHEGRIDLAEFAGERVTLEFATRSTVDDNRYCSAMWAEPRIIGEEETSYETPARNRIQEWGESFISGWQQRAMQAKVETRRSATLGLFDAVDLFVAPSPFLRSTFIQYGMPEEKIIFSDYGIADLGYTETPREPTSPVRFTFVGTLVEHKGVHTLVKAFQALPENSATLNLYGSLDEFTGYVKRLRSMATHPGIRFRGRAENKDIPRILGESDALIVPSIWFENSPITIHEAFLAQVPVITSRFGGMADLVQHEKNGLLFEVGDADSLAAVLKRCVDDPGLLLRCRPDPASVKSLEYDAEWMEEQYKTLCASTAPVG